MIKFKDSVTSQPKDLNPSVTLTINAVQKSENTPIVPKGEETVSSHGLEIPLVTSNDGLYEDDTEKGRYIYRGGNPNNYMTFNGETAGWRIIGFENDGTIKVIRNKSIGKFSFDEPGNRNSITSTYCVEASNNGCNAWAATINLVGTPSVFTLYSPNGNSNTDMTTYSGTVTQDASLNTWLKGMYYDNPSNNANYLGEDKEYIVKHDFYVGTPGGTNDTESIALDSQQEKSYVWNGYVGLIQVTDYMKASTNNQCNSIDAAYNNTNVCDSNWLSHISGKYWTISPIISSRPIGVWQILSNKLSSSNGGVYTKVQLNVLPSIYLSSNIKLAGTGSQNDPYYMDD